MTEIIHNYPAGKDGTIIFGPWEDAEVNNHMAYYIENIIRDCREMLSFPNKSIANVLNTLYLSSGAKDSSATA